MSKAPKKPQPVVMNFYVELTDDEVKAKGEALAETHRQLNAVKADKKATNADFKSKIDKLEAEKNHLSDTIHDGKELRSVDCFWERDDGRGRMVLTRSDNKQIVEERAMTDAERQKELPGVEAPPAEAAPAAEADPFEPGEQLDGRGAPRAEDEPAPTAEELPDLPQTEAAPPVEAKKKRGRKPKAAAAPEQANGAAHPGEPDPFDSPPPAAA
jgi:hypothetical protein